MVTKWALPQESRDRDHPLLLSSSFVSISPGERRTCTCVQPAGAGAAADDVELQVNRDADAEKTPALQLQCIHHLEVGTDDDVSGDVKAANDGPTAAEYAAKRKSLELLEPNFTGDTE